jgi:arylsulfatase A
MGRKRDPPFFAYYSTILTHIPVVPTPHNKQLTTTPQEKFAGMLRYADHLIDRLTKALEELSLRKNTVVFITVDNGTDNGSDQKAYQSLGGRINGRISGEGIYSLTERGINVPLIVNCPALVAQGSSSNNLVAASDILPTLAELAGAKLPLVRIDGQSFAPHLLGRTPAQPDRPWCFSQYYKTRVVRDLRYKLYSSGQFYDLSEEPLEQHNLKSRKPTTNEEDLLALKQLQGVLDSLPDNAKLPWGFRSISARKIRARRTTAAKKQRKPSGN